MARPASKDPLDRFRWSVDIEGFTRSGFSSCDVPSYQIQTKPYAEGGQHLAPLQIIDSISYKPVTLLRGVTADISFDGWARQTFDLINGKSSTVQAQASNNTTAPASQSQNSYPVSYRRTVIIKHLNRKGQLVKTYTLYNAFPIEYEPASSFAADGDDVLSMEKLVLAYESFDVVSSAQDANPTDIRDIAKRLFSRL